MNVQDFYNVTGGNYEDILRRLRDEERITKFLSKFADEPSFAQLSHAMAQGDYDTAFRASHSLKGICMNLGLTRLQQASSDLTESLRGGKPNDNTPTLLEKVVQSYGETLECLEKMLKSQQKDGSDHAKEG